MYMGITYNTLGLRDFEGLAKNSNSTFLCGNGLSINFDDRLQMRNLGKSLYHAHCEWKRTAVYKVLSNQTFKDGLKSNYAGAKKIINRIKSESDLLAFFNSGISVVKTLIDNGTLTKWFDGEGYNKRLEFGASVVGTLRTLMNQAQTDGVASANYEYWSLVVYLVLALKKAPETIYKRDEHNMFENAVLEGSQYSYLTESTFSAIIDETVINGVFIYLRYLFSINILLDGSGLNPTKFSKWNYLDLKTIDAFLGNFKHLATTNYDLIIEKITGRKVLHIHGEYNKSENVVFYQTLLLHDGMDKIDLSTIMIGDYITNKTFAANVSQLSSKNNPNSSLRYYADVFRELIKNHTSNVFIIFGLCIDNDYHIIRFLQTEMMMQQINNAEIVYCFWDEPAKEGFLSAYEKCITYSSDANEFVKNSIKLSLVK